MKKTILIGFIALSNSMLAQIPTSGLMDRWEFTGNMLSGSGSNNGFSSSPPTLITDRCGSPNSAYSFNGISNYINIPMLGPTGGAARSVAFWLRSTNTMINSPRSIFDYGEQTGHGDAFQVSYNYCAAGVGVDVSNQAFITGGSCISDGNWHHVALVYSGGSTAYSNTQVYIDGIVQSITCNVSGLSQLMATGTLDPIRIGQDAHLNQRYFQGDLDDFYLYNRALTATEVQNIMNNGCGITPVCYCNGVNVFTTPPVSGATYNWSTTWGGSSSTNVLILSSGSGPGIVGVTINTSCGGTITRTLSYNYCNTSGVPVNLTTHDVTYCTNSSTSVLLTAGSSVSGVTYIWNPGGMSGSSVLVSPPVTTMYHVTAFPPPGSDFCPQTKDVLVTVIEDCCSDPIDPDVPIFPTNPSGTYSGIYYVNNDVLLSGSTNLQNAVLLFKPNVKITVPNSFYLNLEKAHLYACGIKMWQGIVVDDGGSISSSLLPGGIDSPNLIEDAIVGVDLQNYSALFAAPPIDLSNTTFNKNHVGIKISNSDPMVSHLPIRLLGCVFSSRDLPFTNTTWPSTSISDLRYTAISPLTSVVAPYLLQSYPQINTKIPYSNQNAMAGILINSIANNPALPTSAGVDIGVTFQGASTEFNLFDGLGVGIDVTDASLTTMNNVFQNMTYRSSIAGMLGTGIAHRVTSPPSPNMNARLDLRPVGATNQSLNYGNRFWDCYQGVQTKDVFEFNIEYGLFRSGHSTVMLGYTPGNYGIILESDRFDYNIKYSEFNNVNIGISIDNQLGAYDMGAGAVPNGIYASNIVIQENYFGPQITSSTPLVNNEYLSEAIQLGGPNIPPYNNIGTANIISNRIDRAYRGISVNSMFDYPITIAGNDIYIEDDIAFGLNQYGVSATDNQGNLSINDNVMYSTGTYNPRTTLVFCAKNQGVGSPIVSCNILHDSYQAFEFFDNNQNCIWKGNSMTNHEYGLVLSNNGVIGTQGGPLLASGNSWNGTWSAPGWETYCNNSDASLSPLWVMPIAPYYPNNNIGGFIPYSPATIFTCRKGNYKCPAPGYPNVPKQKTSFSEPTAIAENVEDKQQFNIELFPNPTNGSVTIKSLNETNLLMVRILDLTGKIVYTKNVSGSSYTLDISSLKSSMYFIEIEGGNKVITRKKIIKE